jgi:hypothetical protein
MKEDDDAALQNKSNELEGAIKEDIIKEEAIHLTTEMIMKNLSLAERKALMEMVSEDLKEGKEEKASYDLEQAKHLIEELEKQQELLEPDEEPKKRGDNDKARTVFGWGR